MPKAVLRSNAYAPRSSRPMGGMNVTPFIDVLLVLLVMVILAVPMPVHQTSVDLPGKPPITPLPIAAQNTVSIDNADHLFWNGTPVSREDLSLQVAAASGREDEPLLRFEPAALTSYDTAARTIVLIKEAGARKFAFIGNERHKTFN